MPLIPGAGPGIYSPNSVPGGSTAGITPSPGAPYPGLSTTQMPMQQGTTTPSSVSDFEIAPGSPTSLDIEYTQGYLKTQIGKRVLVSFLLGTNTMQDRSGILDKVGISYIILRQPESNNLVLCDIYSIKFVTVYKTTA
jgi:hypothetical protein